MPKYRLLTGSHSQGARHFRPGQVVESEDDLCALYNVSTLPPRFELVPEDSVAEDMTPQRQIWDPLGERNLPPPR